ncbi:MAG: AI-2E family transporter [Deltaproteobacteria bacterium]
MAPMQARWSNWLLFALFLAGVFLFYDIVSDYVLPVVMGGFTAIVFQGLCDWIARRLGGRRRIASILATIGVVLAILLPLAVLAGLVTEEAIGMLSFARLHLGAQGLADLWSGKVPLPLARALNDVIGWSGISQGQIEAAVASLHGRLAQAASGAFAFTSRTLLDAVLFCLAMYYTFADGRRWLEDIIHLVPLEERHAREFCRAFRDVAGAVLFGMTSLALLHGLAGGIGYTLARAPHALVLAALQVGFAFVPVIGTAVLWIPASLVLLLSGRVGAGAFLFVYMAVVSLGLEQGLRPQLMRGRMALHPFLLLLSVLGGVSVFGFAGFLVGPLVVSLLTAVIRIYRRDFVGAPPLRGVA